MASIVPALVPIFLLIVLGYAMRRGRFVTVEFWAGAEKSTYYIFFPSLLFENLVTAELDIRAVLPMAAALAGGVLLTGLLLLALRPVWRPGGTPVEGPAFTSIFQGAIRPNTYVGLAAAASLFGHSGLTLTAIGIAAVVPLVNVLAVIVLARHGAGSDPSLKGTLLGIVTNPIIVSVILGLAANAAGLPMPPVVGPTLHILGTTALPVGLLAAGAGLDLAAASRAGRHVGLAAAGKLILCPALTGALCLAFGVGGVALAVAVLYNALPSSASSYVLARQMGGDAALMAGIITATTIAAAVTIPLMLTLAVALSPFG